MASSRRDWVVAAVLAGIAYVVIGRVFALPREHAIAWRYAAWLASGVVFAAHIGHERFRLRSTDRGTALHAALGVALGGFGLAFIGMARSGVRPAWLLALVLWPAFTAIPAFVVALVGGVVLTRLQRSLAAK